MLEACGCVMFYMIHENKTKICGLDKYYCAESVKDNFLMHREEFKCYEPCNSISYGVWSEEDSRYGFVF